MSKIREKESLECVRPIFEHQKPKSFQGPLAGPGPQPQNARFTRATPLRYVGNFRPQKLGPPP